MRVRRVRIVPLACVVGLGLTSCVAGPETDFWKSSSQNRCATRQAVVGETADQDASGNTGALAVTKSRFGDCTGERSFGADINFMEAEARLIKYRVDGSGTFVCAVKIDMATQSYAYGIDVTAGGRCGYGYYRADGWHSIDIGGVTHTGTSTSPSGYNS